MLFLLLCFPTGKPVLLVFSLVHTMSTEDDRLALLVLLARPCAKFCRDFVVAGLDTFCSSPLETDSFPSEKHDGKL